MIYRMKTTLPVLAAILAVFVTAECAETLTMNANLIDLRITEVTNKASTPTNLIVAVCFTNKSTNELKLLSIFEPVPVFFSWSVQKKGSAPLDLPGAGKIAFGPEAIAYIHLKPNESYTLNMDLVQFIQRSGLSFADGHYEISTSYRNQYGKDCVKGIFKSNVIDVRLKSGD